MILPVGLPSNGATRGAGRRIALLGAFFFLNELGSFFTGVLACTLLVKRAGAECLPAVYLLLNLICLPVTLLVILRPPRSSQAMIRWTMILMLLLLGLSIPVSGSSNVLILGAIFIVSRAGKMMVTTFDAGLVSETLPMREARMATPRLLACQTAGLVAGGLLLDPFISAFGNEVTYVLLWLTTAAALTSVVLLDPTDPPAEGSPPPGISTRQDRSTGWLSTVRTTLREVTGSPLPRRMGLFAFYTVSLRYLIEFVSSEAQARHFASEKAMAAFAGNFEAALSLTVVIVQLALLGPAMRQLRVGGLALILPLALVVSLTGAILHGSFETILATQFLYWLCLDGFAQAVRQVMMGAVPPDLRARTPILFTVATLGGSLFASILLLPLAGHGTSVPVLVAAWILATGFLIASIPAGRIYLATLTRTLATREADGVDETSGSAPEDPEDERAARISTLLSSPDAARRLHAVQGCRELGPAAAERLLARQLTRESDPVVLRTALEILARWKSPSVLSLLRKRSHDRDPRVRGDALEDLSFFTDAPEAGTLLRERLEASREPAARLGTRERASILIAALRGVGDRASMEVALDQLREMATDPDRATTRAAAVRVMTRLGAPCFFDDLLNFLFDDALEVRAAALAALTTLNVPAAHAALAAAAAVETDAGLKTRLSNALSSLADRNTETLLDAMDRFTAAERRQVRSILARSSGPGDVCPVILRAGLASDDETYRRLLIHLVYSMHDERQLAALELCVSRDPGRPDFGPLLDVLGSQGVAPSDPTVEALAPLIERKALDGLIRHVTELTLRFWRTAILQTELADRSGEGRSPEIDRSVDEASSRLLDRIITAASLGTRAPGRAGELMRVAIGSDRQRSSVALEVLETWIPLPIGDVLLPVLESFAEPELRRRRALEFVGLDSAGATRAGAVEIPDVQGVV